MPILDGTPGWATALGALIGGTGNFVANRQQARQDQQKQEETRQKEAATAARQAAIDAALAKSRGLQDTQTQQEIDKNTRDAQAAASVAAFRAKGFRYPANWNKLTADQKSAYLQQRLNAAAAAGDQQTYTDTLNTIKAINDPAEKAARLQEQRAELQARIADADRREDRALQARLIAAMDRVGRGQELSPYQAAELGLRSDEFKERKREFDIDHPKGGKPKQDPKLSEGEARAKDLDDAIAHYNKPGANQDAIKRHFAAKWGIAPDKVDGYFP